MAKRKGRGGVGPGRPPLPVAERRRNRVMFTLTDAEYDALIEAAGDKQVSSFVRRIVVRSVARRS